jgi:hypothetical protein
MSDMRKTARQCVSCPWRVEVIPARDVPDYDPGIYARMRATLRSGLGSMQGTRIVMECHNGKRQDRACAGWLHHQIGVGNNLGVRIAVACGRLPAPKVIGEQHETLDDLDE